MLFFLPMCRLKATGKIMKRMDSFFLFSFSFYYSARHHTVTMAMLLWAFQVVWI